MAVLDPNGPRTRGPHAPKPRTGRAGDEWQDPNGPAHRAIACLLEKRSDDGVPEVQLRVVRV